LGGSGTLSEGVGHRTNGFDVQLNAFFQPQFLRFLGAP
jgi:hypothetical protein